MIITWMVKYHSNMGERLMQIEITVPIIVNDVVICEFDAAVDIRVTSYGCPAQTYGPPENCDSGEGPEWEVEATYVEAGERDKNGYLISNLVECPDELLTFVTQYIEGQKFMDKVCDAIAEEDSPGYSDEPDYHE